MQVVSTLEDIFIICQILLPRHKHNLSAFSVYTFSALLTLRCACVNEWHALCEANDEPCSVVLQCLVMTEGSPQNGSLVGGLYRPANAKRHPRSLRGEQPKMVKASGLNFYFSVSFSWSLWPFHNFVGNVAHWRREWQTTSVFENRALRTPWTVWKGKIIGYWKRNSPGQ